MFKYEDMDFQSLTNSLDIENPDGPEELYAMAQFCRMGKGTQASEEDYRFYLQRAADAGSEQARQELDALNSADAATAAEPPAEARAVEGMSLPELIQAADSGNPYALLPLAEKAMSKEFLDLPKAKQWLERAAEQVPQGVYSDEDATKIYLLLGGLLKSKQFDTPENRTACHRYYSLAAEMGSGEACDELADQYENGYGCTADPEKAKFYRDRGAKKNDPTYLCAQCYKLLTENGSRLELVDMLARVRTLTQDQDILSFADLLSAAGGLGELKPETAEWAWAQESGGNILTKFYNTFENKLTPGNLLAMAYGSDLQAAINRKLPVDAKKAGILADLMPKLENAFQWAEYGAKQGDVLSEFLLAMCYGHGAGTEEDPKAAFDCFLKTAQAGYVNGQAAVAECYRSGYGTEENAEQCIFWGEKAANATSVAIPIPHRNSTLDVCDKAMLTLGKLYMWNDSVCDYEKARYWLERAASGVFDTQAPGLLGDMYCCADGIPHDYAKAVQYYERGVQLNDPNAQLGLGILYENALGVPQDYTKAAKLYQEASERGNVDATNYLGRLYEDGFGVAQNDAKAASLYQKAADMGDTEAIGNLAAMYYNGKGVPQSYARAFSLYKKAEAQGECRYLALSECYLLGRGTDKSYDLAVQYLLDAYENDEADKDETIQGLLNAASIAKKNDPEYDLVPIFTKAVELGSTNAMLLLARMYETGDGAAQDLDKAEAYYKDAARAGSKDAVDWLLAKKNGTLPTAHAPAQTYTDPLLQKAADLLKSKTPSDERDRVKLQLSLRENDPEADKLLAALNAQEAEADDVYQEAMEHRAKQKEAIEAGNTLLASIESSECRKKLQEAATRGNARAAAELKRTQQAESALLEAERCLADRSSPEERSRIEALLQQGVDCCLAEAIQLLNPMLEEDRVAAEKYQQAMNCIRAGGAEDRDQAIALLYECCAVGHKQASDTLSILKEDYIKQQMLSGGMTRRDAVSQWNATYVDKETAEETASAVQAVQDSDKDYKDALLQRAAELLKSNTYGEERERVKLQLSLRDTDSESIRLLEALEAQESGVDNIYREAQEHYAKQKAALKAGNTVLASIEGSEYKNQLQEAARAGHAAASAALSTLQQAEAALQEAERHLANRNNPAERGNIEALLQQGVNCCLPQAIELLNPMLAEDRAAEEKYRQAMNCIRAGGAEDREKAISLLNECCAVGHKQSADTLAILKEDYIKQQMISGGLSRSDAEVQWDARYAQSEQELFARANALLNGENAPAERERVEKLLEMRSANPEAQRLLKALHDRDSAAQRDLDEARSHLQKAAESKKPAAAQTERQRAIDLLQSAAAKGSTDAQDELTHVQNGPDILAEAEKLMVSRRKPGMRTKARVLLERADGCGLPRVTELLNMLQREEKDAQTRYQDALTLLNTDDADNRRRAISFLQQNAAAGFTQSADLLRQLGVGQPSANGKAAPDAEPVYSSTTQDDSTMLSDDRYNLGRHLSGHALIFVIAEILGSLLGRIPFVGSGISILCSLIALIAMFNALRYLFKAVFVHHIPLGDPDMRRGYRAGPGDLSFIVWDLFTKEKK